MEILLLTLGAPEKILIFLVGLPLILTIYALIDITRSKFKDPINKIVWVIITVFVPLIGSILYLLFGRSQKQVPVFNSDL